MVRILSQKDGKEFEKQKWNNLREKMKFFFNTRRQLKLMNIMEREELEITSGIKME